MPEYDLTHDPHWPGPKPGAVFGQSPPDDLAPRGSKEWKKALNAYRMTKVNQAFLARERGEVDFGNRGSLENYLSGAGITGEKGGGRHMRGLFLGDIPHGQAAPQGGLNSFLTAYTPYWKWNMDRQLQGGHAVRAGANDPNFPGGTTYDPGNMSALSIPGFGYTGGYGMYEGRPPGMNFSNYTMPTPVTPGTTATTGPANAPVRKDGFSPVSTPIRRTDPRTGRGRTQSQTTNRYFRY